MQIHRFLIIFGLSLVFDALVLPFVIFAGFSAWPRETQVLAFMAVCLLSWLLFDTSLCRNDDPWDRA
jgi:hypothetical protein